AVSGDERAAGSQADDHSSDAQQGAATAEAGCGFPLPFELWPANGRTTKRIVTNPWTKAPVEINDYQLTPSQQAAAREFLARFANSRVANDCIALTMLDGTTVAVSGIDTGCNDAGCRVSSASLSPRVAKLVFELAVASSMVIKGPDQIFVPEAVNF